MRCTLVHPPTAKYVDQSKKHGLGCFILLCRFVLCFCFYIPLFLVSCLITYQFASPHLRNSDTADIKYWLDGEKGCSSSLGCENAENGLWVLLPENLSLWVLMQENLNLWVLKVIEVFWLGKGCFNCEERGSFHRILLIKQEKMVSTFALQTERFCFSNM